VNGEIVIRSGNVEQIQVDTTVYVEGLEGDEAKRVADDSKIVFSGDGTLQPPKTSAAMSKRRRPTVP
jgi:formylmethanofuran dehydrogenase subunit A